MYDRNRKNTCKQVITLKKFDGFTLIEILVALGIMSIAMVFLATGLYNIEALTNENHNRLEMGKILQQNMERLLAEDREIVSQTFTDKEYEVEVFVEPYYSGNLLIVQVVVTDLDNNKLNAGVLYRQKEP